MLEIWKKRWRDSATLDRDGSQDAPTGGLDVDAFRLESTAATLPAGVSSSVPSASLSNKRPSSHEDFLDSPKRHEKKLKASQKEDSPSSLDLSHALELALQENTIILLPSVSSASGILANFICSMVESMRHVGEFKGIALIVVDDNNFLEILLNDLRKMTHRINIANYCDPAVDSLSNPWKEQTGDAVLIDSSSLHRHLAQNWVPLHRVHSIAVGDTLRAGTDELSPPVIQTVEELYRAVDVRPKPRLLLTLFSPMNTHHVLNFNLLSLEAILHAKLYGLSAENRAQFLNLPYNVQEVVIPYEPSGPFQDTQLARQLHVVVRSESNLYHHFTRYRAVLSELGPCAADMYWTWAMKEIGPTSSCAFGSDIFGIIRGFESTPPVLDMSSQDFNITPKFLKLVQILKSCEELGENFRGIVFVQKRAVAFIMVELLQVLSEHLNFIRPCALVDARSFPASTQNSILYKFASGSINLLVATKSVEDLDLPKASIVVRFNLTDSHISQAYVRSCTCEHMGYIVYMVEENDTPGRHTLSQVTQPSAATRRWTNILCRCPQSSVPNFVLHEDCDSDIADSEDDGETEEQEMTFIEDPTTGGRIYPHYATNVLYRMFSQASATSDGNSTYHPFCEFAVRGQEYICRILLPGISPLPNWSSPSVSKAHARRLAAFVACTQLFDAGVLDYRLFPTPYLAPRSTVLPPLDKTFAGTRCYNRREPRFWNNVATVSTTLLYPTVITVDSSNNSIPYHAPIIFLTRQPLPSLPNFNIFFAGLPATVRLTAGAPFSLDAERLELICSYTVRLWRGILNKPYSSSVDQALCFCAPLRPDWNSKIQSCNRFELPLVHTHIPWDLVSIAASEWIVPLKYDKAEELASDVVDAAIQDRWTQYTRRYDTVKIRPDLSPLSKPEDSEYAKYDNLIEVCKAHRKDFGGLKNNNQPLIEVSKFPSFVDRLNPAARPLTPPNSTRKHFIPELCAKVTVPASTLRTALLLPCVMRRIDDFLLVKELNAVLFNHSISEQLLHAAISTPSAGIEYDYERLELLGDAFLKYLSSIYVFVMHPDSDEGAMHNYRQTIISNKTLLHSAITVDLPSYIQSRPFSLKFWYPSKARPDGTTKMDRAKIENESGCQLNNLQNDPKEVEASSLSTGHATTASSGRTKRKGKERPVHWLGDKAIADVSEAIIGAAFLSGGRNAALKVTKHLNIPVPHIEQWSDFGRRAPTASAQNALIKVNQASIEAIEAITGTRFGRPHVLAQALTHVSKTGTQSTSYERLEFIGDAILDFLVIEHIFDRNPQMSPGGLTLLKGAMVSNSTLAAVCTWAGLHHHIVFESAHLGSEIRAYTVLLEQKQADEYAAAAREGRMTGQYWHNIEPPKILSDVVESIIGAIYVSDDYASAGVDAFFARVLKPFYDRHVTLQTVSHHPTKILFELIQAKGCQQFQIIKEDSEYLVLIHDIVLATGQCGTETSAAKLASLSALDALEGDPGFLQRTCDCWKSSTLKKAQKLASETQIERLLSSFGEDDDIGAE